MRNRLIAVAICLCATTLLAAPAQAQNNNIGELSVNFWMPDPEIVIQSAQLTGVSQGTITDLDLVQEFGIEDKSFPEIRFSVGRKLEKLGWRASDTAELVFEECHVPADNLLGREGEGFAQIMGNFQWERLSLALGAVGAGEEILQQAIEFTKTRKAFGKTLSEMQLIRHRLADLATDLESARQLTYHALRLHAAGEYALGQTAMAKKVATEMCCRIADQSLQLHGGAGYMMEFDIQRHWRDARLGPIGGGTSEIMTEIIAKQMGL